MNLFSRKISLETRNPLLNHSNIDIEIDEETPRKFDARNIENIIRNYYYHMDMCKD